MKYRVKLLLPFLCAILLVACEKDDTASSGEKDLHIHGLKEKHISMKDLKAMPKAIEALEKVLQKKSKAKNNKNAYDPDNDFFINTDSILLIENGSYSSLTFPIFRLEDKGVLENLVLSKDSKGEYTAAIYEYNLTSQEKESIKQEEPTLFTNPVKRTDIVFDDSHLNKSLIQVWYTDIVVIRCSSSEHGEKNFGEWHQCTAAQKPQVLVITRSVVIDDGSGEGGWTSGGNYGGGGSGSGGSGSGGGSGPYNPNIPAFNPDTDMALVEGRITRPQLALPTGEQVFYNSLSPAQKATMNYKSVRVPILDYLGRNNYSSESMDFARWAYIS